MKMMRGFLFAGFLAATAAAMADDPQKFQFSGTVFQANESSKRVKVRINVINRPQTEDTVSVDLSTLDRDSDTATPDEDYTAGTQTVTFGGDDPNTQEDETERSKEVLVVINNDGIDEPQTETFGVGLGNPVGGELGTPIEATVEIKDSSGPPKLIMDDVAINEPGSGSANAEFRISLNIRSGKEIQVILETENGTAVAPGDYSAVSPTIVFAVGETEKIVSVPVNADGEDEAAETFSLKVKSYTTGGLDFITSDFVAVGTINLPVDEGNSNENSGGNTNENSGGGNTNENSGGNTNENGAGNTNANGGVDNGNVNSGGGNENTNGGGGLGNENANTGGTSNENANTGGTANENANTGGTNDANTNGGDPTDSGQDQPNANSSDGTVDTVDEATNAAACGAAPCGAAALGMAPLTLLGLVFAKRANRRSRIGR